MTYLVIAVGVLALAEVFTLTLLGNRNRLVRYYRSSAYKRSVFTEQAQKNSQRWKERDKEQKRKAEQ